MDHFIMKIRNRLCPRGRTNWLDKMRAVELNPWTSGRLTNPKVRAKMSMQHNSVVHLIDPTRKNKQESDSERSLSKLRPSVSRAFVTWTKRANNRFPRSYHDWLTTTDKTTSLLLHSDRLVFGTHQGESSRWWRHRSRSHQGTAARLGTPWVYSTSASVMKWSLGSQPVEESFSAKVPESSTEVRKVFIHDKKEVEDVGQKKQQNEKREMVTEKRWSELERSLTVRMKHKDDYGVNEDSKTWATVWVHLNKEDSQKTMTITDKIGRDYEKRKICSAWRQMHWHQLRSHDAQLFQVTSHVVVGFRSVLRVTISVVVNVPSYSLFTCLWIPCNCSHCENGSFEVLYLHSPSVAADRRQL